MTALTPDETILGLLAARPQHGYQLLEIFNDPDELGNVWKLSTSQLYAVIKRLERQGYISGREVLTENAPPRTEYTLTEVGQVHLSAWLDEPYPSASVRRVRVEFLSRLYIARMLKRPTATVISRQRQMCELERARHLHTRQTLDPQSMGWQAAEFVVAQLEAILRWIDHCVAVSVE